MNSQNPINKPEFYNFLTGKASTAIFRRLQKKLKEGRLFITAEQWTILYNLWQEEGLTQQELAVRTFRDKPSITRLINNLEKMNFVIRVNDKDDRRSNLIFLTKTGRKLKEQGMQMANETIKEALVGVDVNEINIAHEILKKVLINLA